MKRAVRIVIALLIAGLVLAGALALTPLPDALESGFVASTEFTDCDGRPLRILLAEERRYTRVVGLEEISPFLVSATLSAEDKRFRSHPGIDPLAVARALFTALRSGSAHSGASTITQQVIKLADPGPRTLSRKVREMWLALKLERVWDKDRILTEYLNRLDYGNLQTGISAASRSYFGKPASDLDAAEAAFLAGLPKAPGRLDPHVNFEAARERQLHVLRRMRANGHLDTAAYRRAVSEPLLLQPPGHGFEAPHFVDLLLKRRGVVTPRGGVIRTTLDLELNRFVEERLAAHLNRIADKHATGGAVVIIHNPTGEVRALAGSGDYFEAGAGQVNGAWIVRSPGSAVKPFTYLLALENGAEPFTVVADVPTEFSTPTGLYRPNNYNHRFYGPVSLRFALGNSLNVAAIRTLQLAGGPGVLHRTLCEVGITTLDHPADWYGLGLTLGNGEVRLLELVNAFSSLARLGVYHPYRLLLPAGADATDSRRVFDETAAWLLADMLSDNRARAASFGLNSFLNFEFPVACKTGTSSDYRDNWTVGYTPEFTVGVWVGNPDGTPMRGITGVTGAAPIFHDVFCHLHERFGTTWFSRPAGIADYRLQPLTGRRSERPGSILERGRRAPEPERQRDYDVEGRVILPGEYAGWLESSQNNLGNLAVSSRDRSIVRIVQPRPGTVYYLDGDLPADSQWIPLRAEGTDLEWSCPTLPVESGANGERARLVEGRHQIVARNTVSGESAATWIEVRRW